MEKVELHCLQTDLVHIQQLRMKHKLHKFVEVFNVYLECSATSVLCSMQHTNLKNSERFPCIPSSLYRMENIKIKKALLAQIPRGSYQCRLYYQLFFSMPCRPHTRPSQSKQCLLSKNIGKSPMSSNSYFTNFCYAPF